MEYSGNMTHGKPQPGLRFRFYPLLGAGRSGFIFQDYNLLDTLSIKENIALPLAVRDVPAKEIKKYCQNADVAALDAFQSKTGNLLHHYPTCDGKSEHFRRKINVIKILFVCHGNVST